MAHKSLPRTLRRLKIAENTAFSMFLGDTEIKVTPPRGAKFDAAWGLGGDSRGGYLTRVTLFSGQFYSRLEV